MAIENPTWIPPEQTGLSESKPIPIRNYQVFLNRVFGEREPHSLPPDKEQALVETITEVLGTLSPRERNIIQLRFGLSSEGQSPLSQKKVGQLLTPPVVGERVRQIEAKALRKLRHPSRSRRLKDVLPLPDNSIAREIAGLGDLFYGDLKPARTVSLEQLGELGELINCLTIKLKGSTYEVKNLADFLEADTEFVPSKNLPESVAQWMTEELGRAYRDAKAGLYRTEQPEEAKAREEPENQQKDIPIEKLPLDFRTINILKINGITKVQQLRELSAKDLLRLRNIGPKVAQTIQTALVNFYATQWRMDPEQVRKNLVRIQRSSALKGVVDKISNLFSNSETSSADLHKLETLVKRLRQKQPPTT